MIGILYVSTVLKSDATNWLIGVYVVAVWVTISVGFWFYLCDDALSVNAELNL